MSIRVRSAWEIDPLKEEKDIISLLNYFFPDARSGEKVLILVVLCFNDVRLTGEKESGKSSLAAKLFELHIRLNLTHRGIIFGDPTCTYPETSWSHHINSIIDLYVLENFDLDSQEKWTTLICDESKLTQDKYSQATKDYRLLFGVRGLTRRVRTKQIYIVQKDSDWSSELEEEIPINIKCVKEVEEYRTYYVFYNQEFLGSFRSYDLSSFYDESRDATMSWKELLDSMPLVQELREKYMKKQKKKKTH